MSSRSDLNTSQERDPEVLPLEGVRLNEELMGVHAIQQPLEEENPSKSLRFSSLFACFSMFFPGFSLVSHPIRSSGKAFRRVAIELFIHRLHRQHDVEVEGGEAQHQEL